MLIRKPNTTSGRRIPRRLLFRNPANVLPILLLLACFAFSRVDGQKTDMPQKADREREGSMAFTLSMEHPEAHYFHVVFRCSGIKKQVVDFKMPVWTPGYYQVLDYAKNLEHFRASDDRGRELRWERTAQNTWEVQRGASSSVVVQYDIKANTQFVAQSWLDTTRGYITPASVFLYADGYLHHPVTVAVRPWLKWNKVATGLEVVGEEGHMFRAPDFDILYDCPILVGNLEALPPFTIQGIPHDFVGYRLGEFDRVAFMEDLNKVVETGIAIIGDIPYKHYTFLAIGPGRGGIEHLNSTTISFSGEDLRTPDGRQRVLSFIAHEYFHHYNVKRIRPVALGPFDYERENRTNMLWVSEGLTVYYEYLILRRAGLMSGDALLHDLESDMAAYENKPGRLFQSLTQASYETWSDGPFGRKGDSVDRTISYYEKGPVVGMLLDFAIRHATNNQRSLDDVMRALYQQYYREKKRGFTDDEFREICEKVAGTALPEIFEYASTVKEIDYAKYLGYAGLELVVNPPRNEHVSGNFHLKPISNPDVLQLAIRKDWMKE